MGRPRILIADDDSSVRETLRSLFEDDFDLELVADGQECLRKLAETEFDVLLLDLWMPKHTGLEVLKALKEKPLIANPYVIMISGAGDIPNVVSAMKYGAGNFITKPFDIDRLFATVTLAIENQQLKKEVENLRNTAPIDLSFPGLVAGSEAMIRVLKILEKVAPTESSVLITGQSGTGKGVIANALHSLSKRKDKPFVAVDCGGIPRDLVESELFGHVKGAFTGAIRDQLGKFEQANGGTLFLDEIGNMPLETQAKLLRVLQERVITRVGGHHSTPVDFRLICATNTSIEDDVETGRFREDLYFRINVVPIHLPPLRERQDDIPRLVSYYLKKFGRSYAIQIEMADAALEKLRAYVWPGNVRELENLIHRLVVLNESGMIGVSELPPAIQAVETKDTTKAQSTADIDLNPGLLISNHLTLDEAEHRLITHRLSLFDGNVSKTARSLGISRRKIQYLLRDNEIQSPHPRLNNQPSDAD